MEWFDFEWLSQPQAWVALAMLSAMEIVLGIDNIVFISILAGKLPEKDRPRARQFGLAIALITRLMLLGCINWIMSLESPFHVFGAETAELATTTGAWRWEVSGKALILLGGGLFLIGKATTELWEKLEGPKHDKAGGGTGASFALVLAQVAILDIVFSLDSVITAVGMAKNLMVMAVAMILAVIVMLVFVNKISAFIDQHPSMKILALSFLILIGVMLTAEGMGEHMPKGYIYTAMCFSLLVELLNMRFRAKSGTAPVELRNEPSA
jgi:predicted tellurium resistance membrane protein TerC